MNDLIQLHHNWLSCPFWPFWLGTIGGTRIRLERRIGL